MRLKGRMLVTVHGSVGIVHSWTRSEVFIHFWDHNEGCFEENAAGTARKSVAIGGKLEWFPPEGKNKSETEGGGDAVG